MKDTLSLTWEHRFASRADHMKSSAIRELLKLAEQPDFISFAGGFPAPEFFPAKEIASIIDGICDADSLQYGPTEGYRPLRQLWADRLGRKVEEVIITTGSQQALDLLGKVLVEPGSTVLVENPTYLAALQAWRVYGARFAGTPLDENGLQVEKLPAQGQFLYTIPTFQNPSGATLSLERRHALVDWSQRQQIPVIEDDPYGALRFDGQPLPRLVELDPHIVHLSTYSKTLAPSLRVGVLVGPAQLLGKLVQAKQATDLHTSTLNQRIAYELDINGYIEKHVVDLRRVYKERRDAMVAAVRKHFPPHAQMFVPQGGMFLWVTMDPDFDSVACLERCVAHKVAYVPGNNFHPYGGDVHTLRLNFSNTRPEMIEEGIRRIAEELHAGG
mgnify:FL=1